MRTWICWYAQDSVTIHAHDKAQAQLKAASALGVSPTKAHYILLRSPTYNAGGDRYTRCYGQVTA